MIPLDFGFSISLGTLYPVKYREKEIFNVLGPAELLKYTRSTLAKRSRSSR